jgi:hypothetical protein
MHNRHEADPRSRPPEIPENWDITLSWDVGDKVIQVEPKLGYLALQTDNQRRNSEYFFDHKGDRLSEAYHSESARFPDSTTIILRGEDMGVLFLADDTPTELNSNVLLSFLGQSDKKEPRFPVTLASFKYQRSKLKCIDLPDVFCFDEKEGRITSPDMSMRLDKRGFGENTEDWRIEESPLDGRHGYIFYQKLNGITTSFKTGDKDGDFNCSWDVSDGKLVVKQIHSKTGITKTLEAPLVLDQKKINEVMLCRPPYEIIKSKTSPDRLDIPWRNIDQIVGASLSYSFPLPQNKLDRLSSF